MKGRMQKIPTSIGSRPQKDSTECESYEGVQTFMDMNENNLKEVQFERGNLLEFILSPSNLNLAYLQVKRLTVHTCKLSVIMAVVEWTDCQPRNWETI